MTYVHSRGVHIYVETVGHGYPLVLHTGAAGDGRMWHAAGYVRRLQGFKCILIDHRGHGRSDRPREVEAHHIEHYVADVIAVLDALDVPRAAFWGYSDGARVGLAAAADHPRRLSALILQGGIDDPIDEDERRSARAERAARARRTREQGMGTLIADIEQAEGLPLPTWLRAHFLETEAEMFALELLGWDTWDGPWPLLPTIAVPTLFVDGEEEDTSNAARAVARMAQARRMVIPGVGHVGAFLRGDVVGPRARAFLDEVVPSAPS